MKISSRGFTLVELMIVIAIIGILAAALFPSLSNYLKRGRDAARVSHVNSIATAAQAFYSDKERFPYANGTAVNFTELTTNYLPKQPKDPLNTSRNNGGGSGSPASYGYGTNTGTSVTPLFYVTALMENVNGGHTGAVASIVGNSAYTGALTFTKWNGRYYVIQNQ